MTSSQALYSIISLISAKTGLKIRSQEELHLQQKINSRVKTLGLKTNYDYLSLLCKGNRETTDEWNQLINLITTGESYFFRDRGQIDLLKHQILPDLTYRKRAEKTLNILSAGCSTGEEVYSVAILLGEVIPNLHEWNINLIGIDINHEAIARAKRGIFPEWSFRGVETHYRSTYFRQRLEGWEIIESIKQRAKFYQCNLIEDAIPVFPIGSVELIICRNVFIYFEHDTINLVLSKFIELLAPSGFLLTGHTELQAQELSPLQVVVFPESLVLQMPLENEVKTDVVVELSPKFYLNYRELAEEAFNQGKYQDTIDYLQDWLTLNPRDESAMLLMAKAQANQGNYTEAERICTEVLHQNHCSIPSLQLLAQIAEEQNQKEQAKEYLRRILYLDPNFFSAYFDLIDLHLLDGEQEQAQTLIKSLENMPELMSIEHKMRLKTTAARLQGA